MYFVIIAACASVALSVCILSGIFKDKHLIGADRMFPSDNTVPPHPPDVRAPKMTRARTI